MSMPDYEWLHHRDTRESEPHAVSGAIPREMLVFAVLLVVTALVFALL